jgi:hypothetical protein
MLAIHRPKFIITIGELFVGGINQFISSLPNFIALNLMEKCVRYIFLRASIEI